MTLFSGFVEDKKEL